MVGEGNLRIHVHDDGSMEVWRYRSGEPGDWQYQFFGVDSKGTRLQFDNPRLAINDEGWDIGYYKSWGFAGTENDTTVEKVSNTTVDQTQIRTVWTAGDLRITQTTVYQPGASYFSLQWAIANEGADLLEDLRFFHGGDTYFEGDDDGGGFWDMANTTVGVQHTPDNGLGGGAGQLGDPDPEISRMSLQGIDPDRYESQDFDMVGDHVGAGHLENVVDPDEDTDNGYALQWNRGALDPNETWNINAFEKFGNVAVGGLQLFGPTQTEGPIDGDVDLEFTLNNTAPQQQSVALGATVDLAGWAATVTSPASPVNVAAAGTQQVIVNVQIPANTPPGTLAQVTLTGDGDTNTAEETAGVMAVGNPGVFQSPVQTGCPQVGCYRLVGVPLFDVAGNSIDEAVLSGIPDTWEVGQYGDVRILFWTGDGYRDINTSTAAGQANGGFTDLAGLAFWRIQAVNHSFEYTGLNPTDDPFQAELQPGWNTFAYPFNDQGRIDTVDLQVTDGVDVYDLTDAGNPLTGHVVWEHEDRDNDGDVDDDDGDGTVYDPAADIRFGFAYWLWVEGIYPVTLLIPNGNLAATEAHRAPAAVSLANEPVPPAPPSVSQAVGSSVDTLGGGGGCFIQTLRE